MKRKFASGISMCILSLLALNGCKLDEEALSASDTIAVSEEAVVDTYFQDMDDLQAVAIDAPSEVEYSGGRTSGTITIEDPRFNCDGVVVTVEPSANSTIDHPAGVITVDFGTAGCTDLKGNVRKGMLLFYYDGKRLESGSTVITTTDNYSINGIVLKGTRTSTNITAAQTDPLKFQVTLQGGQAIFPDNLVATRESDITWSWIRGASPAMDKLIVHSNSTASGTTRYGRTYSVSLLEQLQYNRFCGIAVSGVKKYLIDGEKEVTIDYGDGDCDKTVAVTLNGTTHTISVN